MSTRATYRFVDEHADVTFFIHHDGYPAGAASYFAAMEDHKGAMETYNHGLAEVFFRANDRAEFTTNHEVHGDTQYRYDVGSPRAAWTIESGTGVRYNANAEAMVAWERYGRTWKRFFEGTVAEFVAKYSRVIA